MVECEMQGAGTCAVRSAQNAGKNNGIDTLELHMVAVEEVLKIKNPEFFSQ